MKITAIAVFAALLAAAPIQAQGLESLKSGQLNIALPAFTQLAVAGASGSVEAARIPGYGELIRYLPSEPYTRTKVEGEKDQWIKIWRLSPMIGYDTFAEAQAVKNFWKNALESSGLTITTHNVTSGILGNFDFEIEYSGEKYLALYESETIHSSVASADAAREKADGQLASSGLTTVKSFTVKGGGYIVMAYYQATHTKKKSGRILARRYSPLVLHDTEAAAQAQADRERAALESLAIPVLETSLSSGPNGSLHMLQYIGGEELIHSYASQTFASKAAAEAGLTDFVGALAAAALLDSKVYPAGPWFEDGYAFSVRYAHRHLPSHQGAAR